MEQLKTQFELDEMYSRVARRYDLLNAVVAMGFDRRIRRVASEKTRPGLILDVGTGTGVSCRELRRVHPGSTVVGIDRSPGMLRTAAEKGIVAPVQADARALPFADGTFDGAAAGFVFRPINGDAGAAAEIYRVLKPGARAVVYDVLGVPPGIFGFFYKLALATYVPLCAFILADDPGAYLYFTRSIRESVTAGELAAVFRDAGFSRVEVERMLFGTVTIITADKPVNA